MVVVDDLDRLLDEVRLLWHAMVRAAEELHAGEPVTVGMRAVLELVARDGPAAVPEIARRRGVTRQHVQALVNELVPLGLVALEDNPAHRRSALVRLTRRGQETIERMQRRERRLLDGLRGLPASGELRRAAATVSAVRAAIRGER